MSDPDRRNWHQQTWVRVFVLLLLPLIVGGLFLLSNWITLQKPRSIPQTPETSPPAE